MPPLARRQIGFCVLSSSSLAIGVTIQVRNVFPFFAAETTAVVLGQAIKKIEKLQGVTPFTIAYVTQTALGGHAIPVSQGTMRSLVAGQVA